MEAIGVGESQRHQDNDKDQRECHEGTAEALWRELMNTAARAHLDGTTGARSVTPSPREGRAGRGVVDALTTLGGMPLSLALSPLLRRRERELPLAAIVVLSRCAPAASGERNV